MGDQEVSDRSRGEIKIIYSCCDKPREEIQSQWSKKSHV